MQAEETPAPSNGDGKLTIIQSHKDWYIDEIEDGERLWRLDTSPAIQVQLFAKVAGEEPDACFTGEFRLWIERDERDESGDHRIFYAGDGFEITRERALELLLLGEEAAEMFLEEEILSVYKLPDDPKCH